MRVIARMQYVQPVPVEKISKMYVCFVKNNRKHTELSPLENEDLFEQTILLRLKLLVEDLLEKPKVPTCATLRSAIVNMLDNALPRLPSGIWYHPSTKTQIKALVTSALLECDFCKQEDFRAPRNSKGKNT